MTYISLFDSQRAFFVARRRYSATPSHEDDVESPASWISLYRLFFVYNFSYVIYLLFAILPPYSHRIMDISSETAHGNGPFSGH